MALATADHQAGIVKNKQEFQFRQDVIRGQKREKTKKFLRTQAKTAQSNCHFG